MMLMIVSTFVPSHRYLLAIENLFRLIDCRTTIPYWNFPRFSESLYQPSSSPHSDPDYHIWDTHGGFGSPVTSVENGFCLTEGEFGYPGWRLPVDAEQFMKNKTFVVWVCKNKFGYSWWLENTCRKKLHRNLNRKCLSRAVNQDRDFKTMTNAETKKLILESDLKDFHGKFMEQIIFELHSPIHDKLGT